MTKEIVNEQINKWSQKIGVRVKEIHFRPMKQKWASISTRGRLSINTDVLELPHELTEYIVVHELVHLLIPTHGKLFKSYMTAYLKDWKAREEALLMYTYDN